MIIRYDNLQILQSFSEYPGAVLFAIGLRIDAFEPEMLAIGFAQSMNDQSFHTAPSTAIVLFINEADYGVTLGDDDWKSRDTGRWIPLVDACVILLQCKN